MILCLGRGLQDITEDRNEVFRGSALLLAQVFQFLFGPISELVHTLQKHVNDLIAGRNGRLVKQTDQQREPPGRQKISEVGGMERTCFCGKGRNFHGGNALQEAFHIPKREEPGESSEPVPQMRQGCALGCFLDTVKIRVMSRGILVNEMF
jgi:hypothetical protein